MTPEEIKKMKKFKAQTNNLLNEILTYTHPASSYTGHIYRAIKEFKKKHYTKTVK